MRAFVSYISNALSCPVSKYFSALLKYVYVLYIKVKAIEKKDSVLTGPQQIERLLRPGSTYFNLNPYEVKRFLLVNMCL